MRHWITKAGWMAGLLFFAYLAQGQTVTELVVPKYFGSKTASSANNARTAFAVCLKIDGLLPNTSYDLRTGIGLVTDASNLYGAGNIWSGTAFQSTNLLNYFTTDATGSSGPFWIFYQPTGNGTRFDAGQQHNVRLGWAVSGQTPPTSPIFIGTKIMTALDIAATPRTPATTDDGCFIKGSALAPSHGKFMLMFDNVAGTGDPLFSYMIRPTIPTQVANNELPVAINDIYMQAGSSAAGDYPACVPTGANNPNGVRRVESRNPDNTVFAFNTSATGIWPSGANTTTPLRRDVVTLTSTDTPLVPAGPSIPTVTTDPLVTNITFNTATGGGNVTNSGGAAVTARGLCWGTVANPTIAGTHTVEPGTTGPFTSNMTGLLPNTTYHLRAYATNSAGTAYGADITFNTLCEVMAPVANFYAGNTTIMVGESVNFYDSSLYCPDGWNWSFNGANPPVSTQRNPTGVIYNYPGDYTVCLTATNQWGQNTTCRNAYIHVIGPSNANLVMTEINYRSPAGGTDSLEFIEVYNTDQVPWNLQNFRFTKGIEFTFPGIVLNPAEYVLVAKSSAWMQGTFGVTALQWNAGGALSNQGEAIVIKDPNGFVVDSVYYLPTLPWDTLANGKGPTLELCDPDLNNEDPANWRHAVEYRALTPAGDSLWGSPLEGCSYLPVADFTASDSVIIIGQTVIFTDATSGSAESWFWEFERGVPETYNGKVPPPVQYNILGTYDVKLTVTNNAGASVKYKPGFIQVGTTGTGDSEQHGISSLYPNPVSGDRVMIGFSGTGSYRVDLLSVTGLVVRSTVSEGKALNFYIAGLQGGLYFVKATDLRSGELSIRKLVIQ